MIKYRIFWTQQVFCPKVLLERKLLSKIVSDQNFFSKVFSFEFMTLFLFTYDFVKKLRSFRKISYGLVHALDSYVTVLETHTSLGLVLSVTKSVCLSVPLFLVLTFFTLTQSGEK